MTVYASAARTDSAFERATDRVSIQDYVEKNGVKLSRAGQDLRGPCLLCDSGTTKFRIMAKHKLRKFRCYGCDAQGDVVDLVAQHRKQEPYAAALWLLGEEYQVQKPAAQRAAAPPSGPSNSDKVAAEIWAAAQPFAGTLAERYLLGRGILPDVAAMAGVNLRYHATAKHHWDDRAGAWVRAPAMVAQVVVPGPDGEAVPTGGIHCTYLDRATAGKAGFRRPDGKGADKLMWGRHVLRDGEIWRPGGAWLIGPWPPEAELGTGLVTGEGIETTLALASLVRLRTGRMSRACAALSLGRLQGGWKRDADGCFDPFRPEPDPKMPAFAWPSPAGDPWPEATVGVDRDMKDVKARMLNGRGRPVDVRLTSEVRARICGRLAVAAWKAAGAARARAIAPPPGLDFNDQLRTVLAAMSDGGVK